jgi:hypothetical protein
VNRCLPPARGPSAGAAGRIISLRLAKAVPYLCESGVSASIVQLGTGSASSPDRAYDFVFYLYDYATSKKTTSAAILTVKRFRFAPRGLSYHS